MSLLNNFGHLFDNYLVDSAMEAADLLTADHELAFEGKVHLVPATEGCDKECSEADLDESDLDYLLGDEDPDEEYDDFLDDEGEEACCKKRACEGYEGLLGAMEGLFNKKVYDEHAATALAKEYVTYYGKNGHVNFSKDKSPLEKYCDKYRGKIVTIGGYPVMLATNKKGEFTGFATSVVVPDSKHPDNAVFDYQPFSAIERNMKLQKMKDARKNPATESYEDDDLSDSDALESAIGSIYAALEGKCEDDDKDDKKSKDDEDFDEDIDDDIESDGKKSKKDKNKDDSEEDDNDDSDEDSDDDKKSKKKSKKDDDDSDEDDSDEDDD